MPFEPRHHQEAADHCRQLAEQIPWSSLILERWPAPFAFEYGRLREELRHGQLLAAMFQLKDCAEVLLKLVVCTAGRVLIEHGDPVHQREARQFLLPGRGKKLAMGDWANDGIKLIDAMRRLPEPEGWQPWDSVGRLLRDAQSRKPTSTRLAKELVEIVGWRNQELGHGALRLNFMDFIEGEDAFEDRLRQFHEGLLQHDNAWDGIALVAADGDTAIALTGHAALDENQSALAALLAQRALLPLRLERRTDGATVPTLGLGPYVCLRRRSRKEEVGCYVLNKRIGERHKAQLNLLDYGSGDTAVVGRASGEPTLLAELEHLPEEAVTAEQAATPLGDIQDREVREFLDGISFQREYVLPEYLREALRAFIAAPARDRGVFWLCGPADVGKTLFAYGLATIGAISTILGEDQPPPLVAELMVIVIAIRREYRGTPAALSSDVQMALDRSGDAYFMGLERFLYDAAFADDRPGAFCAWLARIRDQSVGTTGRLLLVLDGLDELPQLDPSVEGGSIAGLLPAAQGLPERVFLLLTSRGRDPAQPLDACPEAVYSAIQTAFIASAEHLRQRYDLDPRSHSDYRTVLRVFFEQRLAGLKLEPAACAALFEQTLEHSEYRFKTLSYFAALLASQAISPADVAAVSATPLREHLAALAAWEPPRKFALIRRILLELAAAEQAHEAEIRWMEPAPVIDRQWLGLDVLELAGRVGYPATQPRELDPRFLTALYSVRELLRSYRGAAAATSRFALGLKGMLEQLATLEEWDTTETLLQLSQNALDEYYAASDEEAQTAALIRLGGSLAALVDRGVRVRCWDKVEAAYWACINQANVYQEAYRTQEALRLCVTAQSLVMLAGSPDEPEETQTTLRHRVAGASMTRGNVWQRRNEFKAAITDYDEAIAIRAALRADLEPQGRWEMGLRNGLAAAYSNRGNAKQDASDYGPSAAMADYDEAITMMDALRADLEPQGRWEIELRSDLANAYSNRGTAKQDASDYGPRAAVADYDEAIAIWDALRADLEPQERWEMGLRNDLARAYINRGNAYYRSEHFLEAIQNWGLAAEIYRKSISRNWLSGGERLLAVIFYQLLGYLALEEWGELADQLLDFVMTYQQFEALWHEQHSEIEPPWREIVRQFAATVHNLTLSQRAAVLTALGENAEAVKQAFGWEE